MNKSLIQRSIVGAGILLLILVHCAIVFRAYPPRLFAANEPPLKGDVSRYFATAYGTSATGRLFGYDPNFMAGYPVGLWNSMGKKGFELAHMLLPHVPLPRLFYGIIVGGCLLMPFVFWFGLRRFCADKTSSITLLLMGMIYWEFSTQVSYFWAFGNMFFPAMSMLVPVLAGLAWDMVSERRAWLSAAAAGVMAALIFYCHTVVLVAAVFPLAAIVIMRIKGLCKLRSLAPLFFSMLLFALLISPWLIPLFRTGSDCVSQPEQWWQSSVKHLIMDLLSDRVYRHHFDRNAMLHAVVVFGLAGAVISWLRDRSIAVALGIGGVFCLVLAYAGSYMGPVAAVQPYRFLTPAVLLLLFPASIGAIWVWNVVRGANRAVRIAAALLVAIALPAFTGYLIDGTTASRHCGLSIEYREAIEAIKDLQPEGRVLCDETSLAHIIPYYCDVPVIGGLSSQAFLKHRFAGMNDKGILFGRLPGKWATSDLQSYLDAYAIEYALFGRADWHAVADANPDCFELVEASGRLRIYRIAGAETSLVMSGDAEVAADYDMIAVSEVRGEDLVLKLHYAPWMVASDGVVLKPIDVLDDPVPMIGCAVPDGVDSFTITVNGRP